MTIKEFIKKIEQYAIDDHGKEAEIIFWDMENNCELKINNQQDSRHPGIETTHYWGCQCISDITINLRKNNEQ
jgi:hypothetical protein